MTGLRCGACGNKTRFDVVETKRVRSFHHYTLGGEVTIEEEDVIDRAIEQVVCRWCGRWDAVEGLDDREVEAQRDRG